MSDEPDSPAGGEEKKPLENDDMGNSQSALDHALDDLEAVLTREHGLPEGPAPRPVDDNGQYTIPLLSDVVIPGAARSEAPHGDEPERPVRQPLSEDAACRHVIQRLASELEVIIQTGVDEALREAKKRIMHRIKDHVEIMLPEILDEIEVRRGETPED